MIQRKKNFIREFVPYEKSTKKYAIDGIRITKKNLEYSNYFLRYNYTKNIC